MVLIFIIIVIMLHVFAHKLTCYTLLSPFIALKL